MELLKTLLHLRELVRGHRIYAAENSWMDVMEAWQRLGRAKTRRRDGIADLDLARILDRSDKVSDLSCLKPVDRLLCRREDASLVDGGAHTGCHERNGLTCLDGTVHDTDIGDHPSKLVKYRVEHKSAKRSVNPFRNRRRNAVHDRLQHIRTPHARLCRYMERIVHRDGKNILDLPADLGDIGTGKIDLVQHRNDLKFCVLSEIRVRDCLRLNALRGVHNQKRPFACAHGTGNLIREVNVPWSVEKIEEVRLAVLRGVLHRDRMALDRNAAFTLQVHGVKGLRLEFARAYGIGEFKYAIGERRLSVIDVCDDAEIADVV